MSGCDSVNWNVLSRMQRPWQLNLQWRAVPHLGASNRKCLTENSGAVNRRLNEAVAARRATWKVGNVSEPAKVRQCTAVEDLVYQDGNFGPDVLRDTQPMKAEADKCVRNMVGPTQVESQSRGCVEDWLQTMHKIMLWMGGALTHAVKSQSFSCIAEQTASISACWMPLVVTVFLKPLLQTKNQLVIKDIWRSLPFALTKDHRSFVSVCKLSVWSRSEVGKLQPAAHPSILCGPFVKTVVNIKV